MEIQFYSLYTPSQCFSHYSETRTTGLALRPAPSELWHVASTAGKLPVKLGVMDFRQGPPQNLPSTTSLPVWVLSHSFHLIWLTTRWWSAVFFFPRVTETHNCRSEDSDTKSVLLGERPESNRSPNLTFAFWAQGTGRRAESNRWGV